MDGVGAPVEMHETVTEFPSVTVMSDPLVIVVLASTVLITLISLRDMQSLTRHNNTQACTYQETQQRSQVLGV